MSVFYSKKNTSLLLIAIVIIGVTAIILTDKSSSSKESSVTRIGFFYGGRTNVFYRAYINNYFEKEGRTISLYTKKLRETELFPISKSHEKNIQINNFGKISGIEIVAAMVAGEIDGGTIGESSFISSISSGAPIVAVAMLGYDKTPGKAIVLRNDFNIASPSDLKGATLISRRAGPGDGIFLREFLKSTDLTENDVTIIDQVDEIDAENWLIDGRIDGGLYHLVAAKKLVESGYGKIYQPMNWMDSQLSHGLLVFTEDYIENNTKIVQDIIIAYANRIKYEQILPAEERDNSWEKGLMMDGSFGGMHIPVYGYPPIVRIELLDAMKELLLQYGVIKNDINIESFVDNSFIETIL